MAILKIKELNFWREMWGPRTEVRITLSPRAAVGGSVVGEGRLTTRLRVSVGRGAVKIKKLEKN